MSFIKELKQQQRKKQTGLTRTKAVGRTDQEHSKQGRRHETQTGKMWHEKQGRKHNHHPDKQTMAHNMANRQET